MAMTMTGDYVLPADRQTVWNALNDAETLKACIPGCESFEKVGDNQFAAVAVAKVGPVKARFKGQVALSDLDPPNGYRIAGEGQGGVAGFAKGGAVVRLEDADGGKAHGHEGGLGVGRQGQLVRRPLPHQGGELLRQRGIDLLEHRPCLREGLGEGLAHADRLAALPRKDESLPHTPRSPPRRGGTGTRRRGSQRPFPCRTLRRRVCPV